MYPDYIVTPMRGELTEIGFTELRSASDVEASLTKKEGTTLLVINSVCGCAAAHARPGVKMALQNGNKPNSIVTVFAGVDKDATAKAREYLLPYPPSSPAIALFKEGKLVHFIERHNIEGRTAEIIADNLKLAFEQFCKN